MKEVFIYAGRDSSGPGMEQVDTVHLTDREVMPQDYAWRALGMVIGAGPSDVPQTVDALVSNGGRKPIRVRARLTYVHPDGRDLVEMPDEGTEGDLGGARSAARVGGVFDGSVGVWDLGQLVYRFDLAQSLVHRLSASLAASQAMGDPVTPERRHELLTALSRLQAITLEQLRRS